MTHQSPLFDLYTLSLHVMSRPGTYNESIRAALPRNVRCLALNCLDGVIITPHLLIQGLHALECHILHRQPDDRHGRDTIFLLLGKPITHTDDLNLLWEADTQFVEPAERT